MEGTGLKVLMISSDRNILASGSAVSNRMAEYGGLVKELHIVLLCNESHGLSAGKISENVWVHPTNSASKFLRPLEAARVGRLISHDIITTQDPFECGWAGWKIKCKSGRPLEVQLHTDPFSSQFLGVINMIRKIIAKQVLRHADGVRVVSDGLKKQISHPNVYTLPIYVDRSRISGEPKFDLHKRFGWKHVVLAVSRISPEKNLDLAIKVVERIPDAGLVVVGDGPERGRFRDTDRLKFVGWQEDLSSYYQTADVFIQTSKFEGYGLSLVEAGLSGLPVVTTPVGVARDLVHVTKASTLEEFADAVRIALENPKLGLMEELEAKILPKGEYLRRMVDNWVNLVK